MALLEIWRSMCVYAKKNAKNFQSTTDFQASCIIYELTYLLHKNVSVIYLKSLAMLKLPFTFKSRYSTEKDHFSGENFQAEYSVGRESRVSVLRTLSETAGPRVLMATF